MFQVTRQDAAITIQAHARGFVARCRCEAEFSQLGTQAPLETVHRVRAIVWDYRLQAQRSKQLLQSLETP